MSNFTCICGHNTNTHTDDKSKNGGLLWDDEQEKVDQLIEQDLSDYSKALDTDKKVEWLTRF